MGTHGAARLVRLRLYIPDCGTIELPAELPKENVMPRLSSLYAVFVAVLFLAAGAAEAQTLDEIIARNIKSKGGLEKIRATTSVKMTGKVAADGKDIVMTIWARRPNMMRREYTVDGKSVVNAFDGTTLWMSAGTAPAQAMPGPQAAYAKQESEFDSVFVDYKEKGHAIEFLGKEKVNGKDAYRLKVQKKGGPPQDYFLDAETGLEIKISTNVDQGGTPGAIVTEMSDYRDVDGRLVPFSTKQLVNGKVMASIALDWVEFNVPVDESVFSMPKATK
jgi:outer membrane lipoprotein-sorting protein